MMLDLFRHRRQDLLVALNDLKGLAELRKDQNIRDSVEDISRKLVENRFYLVVLGQFKRGKSTFINSLLGTRLLPTAIVPLTSIVTILSYGGEECIEVFFQNGDKRCVPRDELVDYVTEKGNPGNEKNVMQVHITYPSSYLKDGVHIIDTPGVGSIFSDNTQVTYNFLPKVDAALFLLAVDPPISRAEIDFLKDVKQYVEKIFFIQNKIDYLDESDRLESMNFSKTVIEEALGDGKVRIYPLSAKLALEGKLNEDEEKLHRSFLPEFDRVLGEFLTREKGKVLLQSVLQSGLKYLADEEFAIKLEQKAVATPVKDLEEKIQLFDKELKRILEQKHDNDYLYEGEIKRLMDFLDRDMDRFRKDRMPELLQDLQKTGESNRRLPTTEYVKLMENTLREGVVHTFDEWIVRQEERINEEYRKISKRFSDRANEIIENLQVASARLFDVAVERVSSDEAISSETRFYYLLGDQPRFFDIEGALDFLSHRLLPKSISQTMVLKDILKKLPARIDANCGRVRGDFKYRIQQSFLKFRWNLNAKIDATADSIRQALQKAMEMKKAGASEVKQLDKQLNQQWSRVETLKNSFHGLKRSLDEL
ncbi:dynamin family protein [Desulfoferrobacter suflitae]|uniref:dynamin family protein n=1 Tax=Desulfoferrobacter suflitae TaxID=2865782 RepID=UPI0021649C96|nr:dynamin family protein [Desulfoferrobacter suflitae]MCK8601825.1 dynamin family protein [Desulfoferrobacter suflitae]